MVQHVMFSGKMKIAFEKELPQDLRVTFGSIALGQPIKFKGGVGQTFFGIKTSLDRVLLYPQGSVVNVQVVELPSYELVEPVEATLTFKDVG